MSKRKKALEKLRQNVRNVRYEELETILLGMGFERLEGKGSHSKFVFGKHILIIPYQKPFLKPYLVKLALQEIEEIEELANEEDED